MNRNKICPDCEVEYLPHIEKCADCGTVLLLHEEHRRVQEDRQQLAAKAIENAVMLRKGDLKWLGNCTMYSSMPAFPALSLRNPAVTHIAAAKNCAWSWLQRTLQGPMSVLRNTSGNCIRNFRLLTNLPNRVTARPVVLLLDADANECSD